MKRLALALLLGSALVGAAQAVVTSTPVGNVSYTALSTDQRLLFTVAFTAPRTITLPSAGASCIGQTCPAAALELIDMTGVVSGTNTLAIAPAANETINNSTSSVIIAEPFGRIILIPTNGTNWQIQIYAPGQFPGTTTNDNAPAGSVGEFIFGITGPSPGSAPGANPTVTSAPAMVTTTAQTLTQVLLSPGDWDCRGQAQLAAVNTGTATAATLFSAWTSTVQNVAGPTIGGNVTVPTNPSFVSIQAASVTSPTWSLGVNPTRYSFAASTSVYLVASATFSAGTPTGVGELGCRRVR